jgi:putative heme-binding domain-containing protein
MANGPDGNLYVADFYREIIETPLSLPDDIKARWNLNSRERGRIWRIKPKQPSIATAKGKKLNDCSSEELVQVLKSPIGWQRDTALQLLAERRPVQPVVIKQLIKLASEQDPVTVVYCMSLLEPWQKLDEDLLLHGLQSQGTDAVALRINSLQLAEKLPRLTTKTIDVINQLCHDDHPHVKFQLALSLGSLALTHQQKLKLASQLLSLKGNDQWMETALLSSASGIELDLLKTLASQNKTSVTVLEKLARLVGKVMPIETLKQDEELRQRLQTDRTAPSLAIIRGLGRVYASTLPGLTTSLSALLHRTDVNFEQHQLAISLLSYSPWSETETLFRELLSPQSSLSTQQQALQSLKAYSEPGVAELLFAHWQGWSPNLRREAQEILLSRGTFINLLLIRAESGTFAWQQIDLARREQLMRSRIADVKKRALALQAKLGVSSRTQVLGKYEPALRLEASSERGKILFVKHCAGCHLLEAQGHVVGPDLLGALGNKTRESILVDILDPNREVDPRYINYVVVTKAGRTLTGIISSESSSSITFKRAEGIEETVLRSDIAEIQGTGKSLMPENLEDQLSPQDLADVMGYLLSQRPRK